MAEFIVGSVRQGNRWGQSGFWRPGDIIDARRTSVMFFTGVCTDETALNYSHEGRKALIDIGDFAVTITDVQLLDGQTNLAGIEPANEQSLIARNMLMYHLFTGNFEGNDIFPDMTMTMPEGVRHSPGTLLSVGYMSVLSTTDTPGSYRLEHDYPLQLVQGPRFEVFARNTNEAR